MEQVTKFYGIDISKDVFDVCTPEGKHLQFTNTVEGFQAYGKLLSANSRSIMEATGCYHQQLAGWLFTHGHGVSVVNPLIIKRFSQMRLRIAKTDKADARMIQTYGQVENPPTWQPPQKFVTQSMEIHGLVELLIRQRTGLKNKLHSIKSKGESFVRTTRSITKLIKQMDEEIAKLESSMEALIREHQGTMYDQLCTIPGIGRKTAMFLIVVTNGFDGFENSKQLSSYMGLAPTVRVSGKSVRGQSRISKAGNTTIRNLLFMCSFTASENNKACRELFNRLVAKGKSKKLALIAVANKLLKQTFAIVKSNTTYDENILEMRLPMN
ncbi:MAG: IS110 family transposase [Bacteroidetes bacterium CHB5]|nr:IS110 family transposase [Bacteroidetes bacterium CHB5]